MSITSAFGNAVSGLTASSRLTEVVSSNIANAMTEGYARRELSLGSETLGGTGGGVRILGVNRIANASLLQDKRLADAAAANTGATTDFYTRLETEIGTPETQGSLSWTITEFENSLLTAASMPDSTARLATAVQSASAVVSKINALSEDIQEQRLVADKSIATQVNTLNDTLQQIEKMNRTITTQISIGNDAAGLMDARQMLVDQISEIVPLRVVQRDNNQISIFTTGGAILLDGNASEIGFDQAGVMSPGYAVGGVLSGLTISGVAVSTLDSGPMGGGTLGAAFALRDEYAPEAQAKLDAVARDLITRFEDASVTTAGQPGLFTDAGTTFDATDPLNEIGLAQRLQVNAVVDPEQGGEVWRMRDGLYAATQGPVSDATLLNAMAAAMTKEVVPASGDFGSTMRSAAGLGADFLSFASSARQSAELVQSYAVARQEGLTEAALADGVDTDYEMQTLLIVEKAYAANARVIQTIDAMLQELLDI